MKKNNKGISITINCKICGKPITKSTDFGMTCENDCEQKQWEKGEYFENEQIKSGKKSDIDKMHNDSNYAPPVTIDWYDFIEELNKNGLEIKNKKYEK